MNDNAMSIGGVAGAYRAASLIPGSATPAAGGPSFADMLERVTSEAMETVRAGDAAASAGIRGELPMQDVIQATMEMETTLKTAVAVRDKLVEAYQEVLRMAV
ncbi:flagellar hook-basal body complex protein FliE [Paracoccus sp. ME4]|uniref:flagellar hook-basal body complex protein FliE n=1 Tax=Paracoccus sp. ME4 TaxID=3138066 RepID=UPI00398B19EF